ncbi:hypothetical protein RchiOBHm_Chr4g0390081 [Rosa chinensis]|uniref:Uncharacterized protein n=1 Tax=Rosa chinensis TaxID=74649 RepID=A0A2P6QQ60_ROSCH|nr:hypothetical protein RchiOBHm_Chr4g0390081 [Rosa chinensis]
MNFEWLVWFRFNKPRNLTLIWLDLEKRRGSRRRRREIAPYEDMVNLKTLLLHSHYFNSRIMASIVASKVVALKPARIKFKAGGDARACHLK